MKVSQVVFILSFILLLNPAVCLQIKDGKILDAQNREIFFHGTNVVVRVPPYIPKTDVYDQKMSFVKEDIQKLKQNGFNAIRLGIMWPGVQPKKDQYNETYLQEMKKIVNLAGESGLYTLIFFYQNILSEAFCGVGVPPWMIQQINRYKTFPFPVQRQKYPLDDNQVPDKIHCKRHCPSAYNHAYDTAQGFDQLYKADSSLNKKFTEYWKKVAQTFKDNRYVIAYELINNPWVGNQFRNPALYIPGFADKLRLQGFYDRLSQAIRSVDPKTPISFEPSPFDGMFPNGFYHPPGGNNYKNQSILSYFYEKLKNSNEIGVRVSDAQRMGIPSLIAKTYGGQKTLAYTEGYQQSWFYWIYKSFGRDQSVENDQFEYYEQLTQKDKLEIIQSGKDEPLGLLHSKLNSHDICPKLIRTYFQRVAGCLSYSNFNPQTGRFVGAYRAQPNGQTIMYMNKQKSYGNKYTIEASPKDKVEVAQSKDEANKNYVAIKYTGEQKDVVIVNVIKM